MGRPEKFKKLTDMIAQIFKEKEKFDTISERYVGKLVRKSEQNIVSFILIIVVNTGIKKVLLPIPR